VPPSWLDKAAPTCASGESVRTMTPNDGCETRGIDARDDGAGESTNVVKLMGDCEVSALEIEAWDANGDDDVLVVVARGGGAAASGADTWAGLPDRFAKCENAFGRGFDPSATAVAAVAAIVVAIVVVTAIDRVSAPCTDCGGTVSATNDDEELF
jgi:hypothetical protein